ncbi:hypothetical protein [Tsukamurella sp. 1534]|uniref:hypothetical protein n=1 Tax=Tsukamurella sp. 1534 TaxID=1151061 RepID=UPI00031EE394|nr:hypothetical protein [Tsukamurella sp. 1534]
MIAKHPGRCIACADPIKPGDHIDLIDTVTLNRWPDEMVKTKTRWRHTACSRGHTDFDLRVYDEAVLDDPADHGTLCPECFTYHRGECA